MRTKHFYKLITLCLFAVVLFSSCNEKISVEEQTRLQSEKIFRDYAALKTYEKLTMEGLIGDKYIYAKWIKHGEGKAHPIFTSRVDVHMRMYALDAVDQGRVIYDNYTNDKPERITLYRGPGANNQVLGVRIALVNMVPGDELEAIIPWYLGYGGQAEMGLRLPPYSILKVLIKLDNIVPENQP